MAANVLIGHATVEQNGAGANASFDVAKYNAVGLQAVSGDANGDGQLLLGGDAPEYQGCANMLTLDQFFDQATEPVLHASSVQTTLALLPCSVDYSNGIPAQSTVSFFIVNEFGARTISDQTLAVSGQLVTVLDSPEFQVGTQGTLTGTTSLQAAGAGVIAMAFETHTNLEDTADQKSAARTVPGRGARSTADVIVIDSPIPVPTATPTQTGEEPSPTATATATLMPTDTPTLTPSATPMPMACVGDYDGHGSVTVDEILAMVNVALGNADLSACQAGDANQDGQITVDEILTAVNNALNGCSS